MAFTAVVSYENPSPPGPRLHHAVRGHPAASQQASVTPGDGPSSEFYYDGKTVVPSRRPRILAAVAEASAPRSTRCWKRATSTPRIYFPFTDVMVADPFGTVAKD